MFSKMRVRSGIVRVHACVCVFVCVSVSVCVCNQIFVLKNAFEKSTETILRPKNYNKANAIAIRLSE